MTAAEGHLHHAADHLLGGVEVGNHTVAKWTDSTYVGWSLTLHLLCLVTHGNHLLSFKGDDRWCIHHNLATVDDDGVGSSEVDGDLLI